MAAVFAQMFDFDVPNAPLTGASGLAIKRGHGPTPLDLSRAHARGKKKDTVAVRGTKYDKVKTNNTTVPNLHSASLRVPTVNEKPVQGTLAGAQPPPLPPRPERRSPPIIVTSPAMFRLRLSDSKHEQMKEGSKSTSPALNKLSNIMAKSPFAETPNLLKSASKRTRYYRLDSPRPKSLQLPKTSHITRNHHRANSMMASPSTFTQPKPQIARFDGKELQPLQLPHQIKIAQRRSFLDHLSAAFGSVKQFVVALSRGLVETTGRVRNLRPSREVGNTPNSMSYRTPNQYIGDVEAGKYTDKDTFKVWDV